jgi:hypothetical protein
VESYLCTVKRTAQREGWPKPKWASLLAPYLSGKAQKAYFDLNVDQAANCEGLKREILSRYGFNLARRAQLVHDWAFDPTLSPRAQMSDLVRLTTGWLLMEVPSLPMHDKVVLDKYFRALPYEMKKTVNMQNPQSPEELLTAVEIHQNTQDLLRGARAERGDAARGKNNTKSREQLKGARTEPAEAVKREGDPN